MAATVEQIAVHAGQLDSPLANAIHKLRLEAWPHLAGRADGTVEFLMMRWQGYSGSERHQPIYHLVYAAGNLVAVAHTFGRTIASRERELSIMGLASVCVARSERCHGYGRLVVQSAFARVDRGDFEFSLFQTTPAVEPFYRRLGVVTIHNRFYNSFADDPTANPFWDPVPMRYPASGSWPSSDIDLRGPGF